MNKVDSENSDVWAFYRDIALDKFNYLIFYELLSKEDRDSCVCSFDCVARYKVIKSNDKQFLLNTWIFDKEEFSVFQHLFKGIEDEELNCLRIKNKTER